MAETPLFDQMSALLTYANGITGAGDTHLGDAVRSLADGYGGGGGSINFNYKCGDFTPDSDLTAYTFEHGCGVVPMMMFVVCESAVQENIKGTMVSWVNLAFNGTTYGQYYARRNTSTGLISMTGGSLITVDGTSCTLTTYNTAHFIRAYQYKWIAIY